MIPQSQISKLSNRLFKEQGGRRIPENILERDYCIAWFLVGLAQAPLKNKLVFKGGTALRRCYFLEYRFSEDLDFTLLQPISLDELKSELELVYQKVKDISNIEFRFSRNDKKTHKNCYTFYLYYEGPLPIRSKAKEIKVDVTLNEHVFYTPENRAVLKNHVEFNDIPDRQKVLVYSLNEIAAEKVLALLDRARTEARDLYDLWYLAVETRSILLDECIPAIEKKLSHRGKSIKDVKDAYHKKESRLKKMWESRLSAQTNYLPEFESVYRSVRRSLKQAKLIISWLIKPSKSLISF